MSEPNWKAEAFRLFGYHLGGSNNQDEIARALAEIDARLREGRDVSVIVREAVEDIIDGEATPVSNHARRLPSPHA